MLLALPLPLGDVCWGATATPASTAEPHAPAASGAGAGSILQGDICYPKAVGGALEGQDVVQVAAGGRHTLVLTADSSLWAFGDNDSCQLGSGRSGEQGFRAAPRRVEGLLRLPVLFAAAGGDHSLVVVQQPAPGERVLPGEAICGGGASWQWRPGMGSAEGHAC